MVPNYDSKYNFTEKTASLSTIILKGLGQIMVQENPVTGCLLLIGIFYGSFFMGAAAILATVCGTATALILKYEKAEIENGLYGFSAALVGVALMLFLKPVILSWILIIIGSSLAAIIQHFFIKRKIPVFTLPFVMVTWLVIFFTQYYFTDILSDPSTATALIIDPFTFGFKGFAQVIFQDNLVSGLLFFIAVFISSPISALYGLTAAIISAIIAFKFSVPINDISMGLFSYNAVLCAIVFANTQIKAGIWVVLSIMLSLLISLFMAEFNIIALTFPFVLASCITLFLKNNTNFLINKH